MCNLSLDTVDDRFVLPSDNSAYPQVEETIEG